MKLQSPAKLVLCKSYSHLIAQRQEGKSDGFAQGAKIVTFTACPNGKL